MTRLPADTHTRRKVMVLPTPAGQQRSRAGQHGRHKVHANVLAVEVFVDVGPDLPRDLVLRQCVVVEELDVRERQVGDDHRVLVFLLAARAVPPVALVADVGASRQAADQPVAAKLAPRLEDELEVRRVVEDVIV